jgi:sulfoxide reductase heme-binding subunit YedZ
MRAADRINGWLRRVPTWPLYPLALLPAAHDFWLAFGNRLGADPVKELEHRLGLLALQFLIAALSVTPLREATGVSLLRFRRMLGLTAFSCAALHFAVWLVLDRQLAWEEVLKDLVKRPYIVVGFTALLMLVPLAATSWNGAVRRMGGAAWRRLHRLAYPATLFAAVHFVWLVKAWPLEPLLYLAAVVLLLGWCRAGAARPGRRRPEGAKNLSRPGVFRLRAPREAPI